MTKGTDPAPAGCVYLCTACGKLARTRYGFDADSKSTQITSGWDESCMLKAELIREEDIAERTPGGRVLKLKEGAKVVEL